MRILSDSKFSSSDNVKNKYTFKMIILVLIFSLTTILLLSLTEMAFAIRKPNEAEFMKKALVIDYWPAWSGKAGAKRLLKEISDKVDVINISFAYPGRDGNIVWPDYVKNPKDILNLTRALQKKGKKVLISFGGLGYTGWNLESPVIREKLVESTKKFVDKYGFDGVDIDCEQGFDNTDGREKREKISEFIVELRKRLPKGRYLLTYAAWSIGAYGTPGHEHPEWNYTNSTKGMEVPILKAVKDQLDWISVMAYDAGSSYNPIEALNAYKDLMGGSDKVVLGIHPGPQSWPAGYLSPLADTKSWMKYASEAGFKGIMFWNLTERDVKTKSQQKTNTYLNLAHDLLHHNS
jgi:chitinase